MLAKLRDVLVLLIAATTAQAQWSVPPLTLPREAGTDVRAVGMRLPESAPARAIVLKPPTAAEHQSLSSLRAKAQGRLPKNAKSRGFAVGFARPVAAPDDAIRLADLPWHRLPSGASATRIALTSPGAVAIRIELALRHAPPGLQLRFQGSRSRALVLGPYSAQELQTDGGSWSPVLEGDTGTIELELPATSSVADARLEISMVSHLGLPRDSLKALDAYIGEAGACQTDVACLASTLQQQLATATNAVARIFVTVKGVTMICSGTLLNDGRASATPYFLTTNHCIDDVDNPATSRGLPAAAASTVNTYWFFQAATCGSLAQPNFVLVAGGAKLLARGADYDWALLRLNAAPPPGSTFAAWNASGPLDAGTNVAALHHPSGDLKKVAQGSTWGYQHYPDGSSFVATQWASGATEAGSSGGGLFTLNPALGAFELRGTLVGGNSSCGFPQGIDQFSRFDVTFPLVQQYLSPDASNPAKLAPVVEFFSAAKNDYLITADPVEIAALDGGTAWVRTGLRFLAYTDPSAAPLTVQPVCRFRVPPASGDTHFWSASSQECSGTLAGSTWVQESAAAFHVALPNSNGNCPANHNAVYRFASNASSPKRRYTAEVVMRDALIDAGGWTQEGSGPAPAQVAMCAPAGNTLGIAPPSAAANYEGMWWAAPAGSESGWGLSVIHQGDTVFATWFTHDATGKSWWLTMTAIKGQSGSYSGLLYETRGPPFNATPFDPNAVTRTPLGAGTLTFTGPTSGTFSYALAGFARTKSITQQVFGPAITCSYMAQPALLQATNYTDLWWVAGGAESGWGLVVTHQGDAIFAVWFTYDVDGSPLMLSATATKSASGAYTGKLYRTRGPPFSAVPFNSAEVVRTEVGSMTLTFANGNAGTFTYSALGVTGTKAITRYLFAPPAATVCG